MVDRSWSSRSENKRFSTTTKSRKSSSVSSEFDEEYREHLEGKYLGNGLEIRPPSGTNHQQPGSHLSIDTRLSELSLADDGRLHSSHPSSGASKKSSQYKVLVDKPNCYITSPFKQGYQIPNKGPTKVVDPSIQLKKVTKESIDKVRQQFRRPRPPPRSSVYTPRLRKAKLRTTGRPISRSGPSIEQCRGIQGGGHVKGRPPPPLHYYNDDRSYTTYSPSFRPGSPSELHRPDSSVHCNSRVPSEIDDSLSDQIDMIFSNDVTESWSANTFNEEQTRDLYNDPGDQRDEEGSLGSSCDEKYEADIDQGLGHLEDLAHVDLKLKDVAEDQKTSNDTGNEDDKVTSKIGTSTKDSSGTCKPFSDAKGNDDDDDDNDDDDDYNRTLLSSYNKQNSNRTQTWRLNTCTSGSGKNETSNGNEMKSETNPKEIREGIQNEIVGDRITSCFSQCVKLSNSSEKNHDVINNINNITQESFKDGIVHIVDSTSNNISPLMTIHVRGRLENSKDDKPGTVSESFENRDINNVEYQTQDDDVNDYDDDDTDRIPSALIWKNLDQLNLSMNASSHSSKERLNFSSQARKVQSAGPQRRTDSYLPRNMDSKPPSKQRSRNPSAKLRKTKTKRNDKIDKSELLKKYLSEESRKFSADLPGYFTEQFNIIQDAKKDRNSGILEENTSKALMKFDNEKDEERAKEKDCDSNGDINEDIKESISLYSVEIEDPSSSGVFFTMDSSTCDMESMSGLTEDTLGQDSDPKELSDDTGFETMPGLSRTQTTDKSIGGDLKYDMQEEQVKVMKPEDLEVVAKAKHLTDPRMNSHYKCCPYEPLNFTINAIPPPGYLFYFAYGVDMNAKRMSLYLRREYKRLWGVLFGFKLCFNKKGSSNDAGGFANVEFSPGCSVEGCVYTITEADLSMLDNCMGYPKHYCRVVLPVWMSNCHDPDQHGVAQYCIPAVLYVAEQQWVEHENVKTLDCSYSVNQCLKASDILTPNYIEYLSQQANP